MPVYHAREFPSMTAAPPPAERITRIIASPETTGYELCSVFHALIPPRGAIPDHAHPDNDEIMYCVGTGEALVDGERVPISTDSVILARRGEVHGIWNTSEGEPLKLFCVFVPALAPQQRFEDLTRKTKEYLRAQAEMSKAKSRTGSNSK